MKGRPAMAIVDEIRELLENAYMKGFVESGEGYNGEHPFCCNEDRIEMDSAWVNRRNNVIDRMMDEMVFGEDDG